MIRFVHTADIHFGMENYGTLDPKTGIHSRLLDFYKALNACIDVALEKNVDFFLFAGDAYKTATPTPMQQRLLFECFLRLFNAKIPLVMITGNHDNPMSFGKAHALDLFGQIPLTGFSVIAQPKTLILDTKSGPVQIVGIPWPTRSTLALNKHVATDHGVDISNYISDSVSALIAHHAQKLNFDVPAVLMAHLTVSTAIFSGSEKRAIHGKDPVFLPSQLALKPFDYVALGHLHRYQNLNPQGHPAVVYSGSLERIDFGERKEEKGFCLVTIHNKQETTHEFIPVPTRPFVQITVYLHEDKSQTDQIIDAIKKQSLKDAIVKIVYHLPAGVQDRVDCKAIHNVCSDALQLIGVFPVHQQVARETRTQVNVAMNLETLLQVYFANKQTPPARTEALIQKTLALEQE